ncbi:MAG: hypothetical protein IJK89_08235 [Clostridia bacterium]|nr:hypothetical protein [Clostridia bacterium]
MKSLKKIFALLLCAALLLGCGLVPSFAEDVATSTDPAPYTEPEIEPVGAAQGSFTFANFNIAGLLALSGSSDKAARQKLLGEKVAADGYDIVAVQEDFSYDADFSAGLNMPYRTDGSQNVVTGDGLEIFSKTPVYNVARQGWNKKGGMLWEGDIVSQKGVMMAVVELQPGVYVDVYNLHGDAFDGQESKEARHDNFTQTMNFINANSSDHAVIVTGDFNSAFHFADEGPDLYNIFIEQLGMKDVWTEVVNGGSFTDYSAYNGIYYWGHWDSVECILYRSSDTLTLTPTSHKYVRYMYDDANAFSDHATAVAGFDYTAATLLSSDGLAPAKKEALNPLKLMQVVFADLKYIFSHFDEVTTLLKYKDDMETLYTNYSR